MTPSSRSICRANLFSSWLHESGDNYLDARRSLNLSPEVVEHIAKVLDDEWYKTAFFQCALALNPDDKAALGRWRLPTRAELTPLC